jgi:tetratricopeptide (TPR) repeat protein
LENYFNILVLFLLFFLVFYSMVIKDLRNLFLSKQYSEYIEKIEELGKWNRYFPGMTFSLLSAYFAYGDSKGFRDTYLSLMNVGRTRKLKFCLLLSYSTILYFLEGKSEEGMLEYDRFISCYSLLKDDKKRKYLGFIKNITDGIRDFEQKDFASAKAIFQYVLDNGRGDLTLFFSNYYMSKICIETGDLDLAEKYLEQAKIRSSRTLYTKYTIRSDESSTVCLIHPDQKVHSNCIVCGTPICDKCSEDHESGKCFSCFKKEFRKSKLESDRKESIHYLRFILIDLVLSILFVSILFGIDIQDSFRSTEFLNLAYPWNAIVTILAISFLIAGTVNGIPLFAKYIKRKKTYIKVLSAVLFFFTFSFIQMSGIVMMVPLICYNLYRYFSSRRQLSYLSSQYKAV